MTDREAAELINTIARLDAEIGAAALTRATLRARAAADAIRPGVRGVVLAEPDDLSEALASVDVDPGWAVIADELNGEGSAAGRRRVATNGRVILRDGSVIEDRAVDAAVTAAFDGFEKEMPLGDVGQALPGVDIVEVLDRLGWPPVASVSLEELFYDDDARQDENRRQLYAWARENIAGNLSAFISLDVEHLNFGLDVDTLERTRDEAHAALGLRNAETVARQVRSHFPDAATVIVAFPYDEFQTAEVIEITADDGTSLYRIEDAPTDTVFVDIHSPDLTGDTVPLPGGKFHSTLSGMDLTHATCIHIEAVLAL